MENNFMFKKCMQPIIRPTRTFIMDSVDTSLTLSQTDGKMQSQQSEISNLSTFYQSCDTKDIALTKTNSFHLNAKIRSNNKISRASKNQLIDVLQDITSPTQTRRKQVIKHDWEYSYRKSNSTFFDSKDKQNNNRSYSQKQYQTQQKSLQLKQMIDQAIQNTKTFDEYLLSVVRC